MNAELAAKVASASATGLRNVFGRAGKVGGPASGTVAICADLGAPVASFSMYFALGSAVLTAIAGWMWFGRRRRATYAALEDGKITPEEMQKITETNVWSVSFAFGVVTTTVLGLVFIAQALTPKPDTGPDRGVIASIVPAMQKMQDSLFNIQQDVTAIKEVTAETKEQTERIESKLDDLSAAFEAVSRKDVLITDPQTPAEHYHNARFSELKGDAAAARKAYTAYLASGAEYIDPCLSWVDMLKVQDGIEGAKEVVAAMQRNNNTRSLSAAAALLQPASARRGLLQKLAEASPDFAPVHYLLSREYSAEKLGEQTISDKAAEKTALEKFRALQEKGQFQKYVLDKRESKKWLDDADARWAKLAATPDSVLKMPVTLTTQQSNQGWGLIFGFADFKVKKVEYRLDGQGEFKETGFAASANPQTGLPMPNTYVDAGKLTEGPHSVEVRYTDMADKVNGPYKLDFNTASAALAQSKQMLTQFSSSWVSFRDYDGKTLLYFTHLLTQRGALKTIRYSLDGEALDKTFPFDPPKPGEEPNTVGDKIFLEVPATTKSVTVELDFADGTKSEKKTFPRQ